MQTHFVNIKKKKKKHYIIKNQSFHQKVSLLFCVINSWIGSNLSKNGWLANRIEKTKHRNHAKNEHKDGKLESELR